jgi:hypothetical protein
MAGSVFVSAALLPQEVVPKVRARRLAAVISVWFSDSLISF